MKACIITIPNHGASQAASDRCIESSINYENDFEVEKFDAIIPDNVEDKLRQYNIKWNYPWTGEVVDFATGLTKKSYPTSKRAARVACGVSHYSLWYACAHSATPYLVLEHDAIFTSKLNYSTINKSKRLVISINDPMGATRRPREYVQGIKEGISDIYGVVTAPYIDERDIPQGLPGNSAYIIKPEGAWKMLKLVDDYGLWPNDALMCRQLIPNIGCTQRFYTKVQGVRSTTTF